MIPGESQTVLESLQSAPESPREGSRKSKTVPESPRQFHRESQKGQESPREFQTVPYSPREGAKLCKVLNYAKCKLVQSAR